MEIIVTPSTIACEETVRAPESETSNNKDIGTIARSLAPALGLSSTDAMPKDLDMHNSIKRLV